MFVETGAFNDVHAALMVHPFPSPYGAFIPTMFTAASSPNSRAPRATSTHLPPRSFGHSGPSSNTTVSELRQNRSAAFTPIGRYR